MLRQVITIEDVCRPNAVVTSDEAVTALRAKGMTDPAARQWLRRAAINGELWRSHHFRLPRNGRLYAQRTFTGTHKFLRAAAAKVMAANRPGFARCLASIAEQGVLLEVEARKLLAVPAGTVLNPKYPDWSSEYNALTEFDVTRYSTLGGRNFLCSPRNTETAVAIAQVAESRLRVESLIARILVDQLRRQNALSWNKYRVADGAVGVVDFNDQLFTAFGFCYLRPVLQWNRKKPTGCPALFEVMSTPCALTHLEAFEERIKRATFRGRTQQRYLGIIAAPEFESKVWTAARKANLWTINLRQAFGREALQAISQIEMLLRSISPSVAAVDDGAVELERLLSELKANPVVAVLRSIGFEAVCALALRSHGWEGVEIGRSVPFGETSREVDVFGFKGDEVRILECRALSGEKRIWDSDVAKFYDETVPAFVKWLRGQGRSFSKVIAEIWTTGEIDPLATKALESVTIDYRSSAVLRNLKDVIAQIPRPLQPRIGQLLTAIAARVGNDKDSEVLVVQPELF